MIDTDINKKILEKLDKFAQNPKEFNMCKDLLMKELQWYDIEDPPFKREFIRLLNIYFPFEEAQEHV